MKRKCIISRYDETIKEPPFLTIKIDEVTVEESEKDYLGEEIARRLQAACYALGYKFKFYTNSSEEEFDYEIVVY